MSAISDYVSSLIGRSVVPTVGELGRGPFPVVRSWVEGHVVMVEVQTPKDGKKTLKAQDCYLYQARKGS